MQSPKETKGLSSAEALRRRAAINSGVVVPGAAPKPDDKPDSPEYRKKQAMMVGPVLDMTYDAAGSYGMEESIYTSLKDIFRTLKTTQIARTGVLSPQRLLELFKQENEMFRSNNHQDAHEFYGILLNSIITNVEAQSKREKDMAQAANDASQANRAISSNGLANGLDFGAPGAGWVHDLFEGVLTSETKCLSCESASRRDETFLDLSIDLEHNASITSCLGQFSAEEQLCERNKFHCDNCGGLQEAEKRMMIKKLPRVLTLHLKRFKYTDDYSSLQKLFYRVAYPFHLRMFYTTEETEDPDRFYELYAVVVHIGANAYHGHYVSIVKTEDRGWMLFDDELVEPVDKQYVQNFFGEGERTNQPGSQACAYVLFYQETTPEKAEREAEAEGTQDVHLATVEAAISMGVYSPPEGTYPSSTSKRVNLGSPLNSPQQSPTTPLDENNQFASLNHAMTTPLSPSTTASGRPLTHMLSSPSIPMFSGAKLDSRAKEEREIQKKAAKELEKAQKALEKDRLKNEANDKKKLETYRRSQATAQAEQLKATLAASKASAAEEEEARRRRANSSPPNTSNSDSTTSSVAGAPEMKKENGLMRNLTLNRNNPGSKSMSRKSFLGFSRSSTDNNMAENFVIKEESMTNSPRTPNGGPVKEKKSLFSGLSRKKSSVA